MSRSVLIILLVILFVIVVYFLYRGGFLGRTTQVAPPVVIPTVSTSPTGTEVSPTQKSTTPTTGY